MYIYQDMLEVYGRTVKLSNLYAAALIMAGRSSEAEGVVLEILNKVIFPLSMHDCLMDAESA